MASQEHSQRVQGQPRVSKAAGPSTSTVPGAELFKNVTRDNGVSFQATDNVSIQSYINALTSTIPAADLISASRISNGRIAVYLSSKEAVINAVQKGLHFGGSLHELTPLVRPTTRLILSNVYPEIPNSILVQNISSFCKVVSQCRPIPLGLKNKLSHVMSFRRQVQVIINPNVTPPDHINFIHSGTNYRVFLSTESARCFNCGEFGHISRTCKKPQTNQSTNQQPSSNTDTRQNKPPSGPPSRPSTSAAAPPSHSKETPLSTAPAQHPAASIPPNPPQNQSTPPRDLPDSQAAPSSANACAARSTPLNPHTSPSPTTPKKNLGHHTKAPTANSSHTTHPITPVRSPSSTPSGNPSPIWKTPPNPVRTFSEVVLSKRKQPTPPPVRDTPILTPITTPSPLRKMPRRINPLKPTESPTLSQALDSSAPEIPSTPASSVGDPATDTDSMAWEDTQTDDDLLPEEVLPIGQGPLSQSEIAKFLASVKGRKKPIQIALKFTSNIPGLVNQLKPLRSSPLLRRNMQQRIYKLISTLEK